VKEDQLSLAIGRRGQNVRLASKLVGWDIEIMTHDELTESIDKAVNWFSELPNIVEEAVESLIQEGFLSYTDLTFLEPAQLAEMTGATEEQAEEMIAFAEEGAERVEEEARLAKESEPRTVSRPTRVVETVPPAESKPTFQSLFGPDEPV